MTSLNLEPFPWLWSLHSCFDIASLMKTVFCGLPSCLPWQRECLGWRELGGRTPCTGTSFVWGERWSFSREMDFLVYEKWETIWTVRPTTAVSVFPCTAPSVCSHPCLLCQLCWAGAVLVCTQLLVKSWALLNKCISECKDIRWEAILFWNTKHFKSAKYQTRRL